ncbi:Hermansky-Pudlak syndrome 1 protein homolog isoform X2 [Zootermopsis nevadensis]|uniref:Hermansky-Pudlak syndrome 1 protein homolog isoform X2 n=1 Tax=Zootermopsis nevadensis TaxID=136037 RepID=UPI000B8E7B63|nr:Hermansky-Pudlak syndrome 1 protein homolog isoform X2 [Zootermopsis nevadensis]
MKCILVFDHLNDVLYAKYNKKFSKHVRKLSREQGFMPDGKDDDELSNSVLIQHFSPIVTSLQLMNCQFGNSYTSVQCKDGTNVVFNQYMGCLFVHIGLNNVNWLQRTLGIFITVVKHLCGPNVSILKRNKSRAFLLSRLLDTWMQLQDSDQAFLVEAVEQLMVNIHLTATSLKALQDTVEKLKTVTEFSRIHAMLLVENKFLSLYSSRGAQELSAGDIMFLSLMCEAFYLAPADTSLVESTESEDADESSGDEFYSPQSSPQCSPSQMRKEYSKPTQDTIRVDSHTSPLRFLDINEADGIISQIVLLMGSGITYNPHVVHICPLEEGVHLVLMFETGNGMVSSGLYDVFHFLNVLQTVHLQGETDEVKHSFENLENGIKKVFEGLKKMRHIRPEIENCQHRLQCKWEFMRKKYLEYIKTTDSDCLLRVEASTTPFLEDLKELLQFTCFDNKVLGIGRDAVLAVAGTVKHRLSDFSSFLKVKALRNFTLGSASLTINKYLEEFPGLVHFLYIDRFNHRITAPSLDFSSEETTSLTKKKIWAMVEFSRAHLQEGHTAIMWKDTTFSYAYFLWFEDSSASPLKPKIFPTAALKNFPRPGILCGDFYQKLAEFCFPKTSLCKVHCYELYCVHLGLATSSCVLEQSRRLAATIWEVTGMPSNPVDLL